MNEMWQALAREAGLAAEHIAIGATALGKANYAQQAYYAQAFFALSIGFERAAKLALVVDHALNHSGSFPQPNTLRDYGHALNKLLERTDELAKQRGLTVIDERLPRTVIHEGIIKVLSDFASNVTRYYNLDLITGDPRAAKHDDPVRAWFDLVIVPILAAHFRPHHRSKREQNARLIEVLLADSALVRQHSERGEALDTIYEASMHTGVTEFARPYARMYVMQIARFLGRFLSELGYAAYKARLDTVPYLSEFFVIFNNSDEYFRRRRVWSIYRL